MPLDTGEPPKGPTGRIGPNAIIQTAVALRTFVGADRTMTIFEAAGLGGLLEHAPDHMVEEAEVRALFDAISREFEPHLVASVLAEAGRLTGQYVLDNRIPKTAQHILQSLPALVSGPLLTRAIAQNAWTFAGSGRLSYRVWPRIEITIADNPIATPGCPWHRAVFERLYGALVSPVAEVRHVPGVDRNVGASDRFVIAM